MRGIRAARQHWVPPLASETRMLRAVRAPQSPSIIAGGGLRRKATPGAAAGVP